MKQPSPADSRGNPSAVARDSRGDPSVVAPANLRRRTALLAMWVPPLVWAALIYFLSAQPSLPRTTEPLLNRVLYALAHALGYAVLAWLLWRPLTAKGNARDWRRFATVLSLCVLYALLDEYHQSFVPGRTADWADVATDAAGALLALLALRQPRVARLARLLDRWPIGP